jgi:hypothetical protein
MNNNQSFQFNMKITDYLTAIKSEIYNYNKHIVNAWSAAENIILQKEGRNVYALRMKGHDVLTPGQKVELDDYPFRFTDGSIFTLAQRIYVPEKHLIIIEESVVTFAKLGDENTIEYVFHYDKIMEETEDHPLYHLQFSYDKNIDTPRFPIHNYETVKDILKMVASQRLTND